MNQHIANVRRQIGELSGLADKTDAAERNIIEAAEKRLEWVQSRLVALRPSALLKDDAGQEYQALSMERARLELVIGQARKNLG